MISIYIFTVFCLRNLFIFVLSEGREKEGEKTNTVALVLWEIVKYTKENVLVNNKE